MLINFFTHFSPLALFSYFFVMGACFGSFINVVNYRLPILIIKSFKEDAVDMLNDYGYKIVKKKDPELFFKNISGRSACPVCSAPISPKYNIPIFGWLLLKGRSACCKQKISPVYPIVEALFAVVFSSSVMAFNMSDAITIMFMFTCLFSLSWIDFKTQIIPDSLSTLLLLFAIIFPSAIGMDLVLSINTAVYTFVTLVLINFIIEKLINKTFIGFGDVKLLTILSLWIGYYGISLVFIISPILLVIYHKVFSKNKENVVPFGPWISAVAFLLFVFNKLGIYLLTYQ